MPLHPQAAAFLAPARCPLDPTRPRAEHRRRPRPGRPPAGPDTLESADRIEDRRLPGDLSVRVDTPADSLGTVLYPYGGGHVMGIVDSYDGLLRRLANRVPASVAAHDYRRAPEHRCPAAVDDVEAVYD